MSADQLLSELRALDIRLSVEDDRLRCNAPKGRLTGALERRIAAHKPEIIRTLRSAAPPPVSILRRPLQDLILPLSFAQERLWFLQRLEPESVAYNITAYRRISVPIEAATLKAALCAIVRRHEILRTNFPEVNGAPTQVVREEAAPEFAVYDLSDVAEPDKPAAARALIQEFSSRKFDLERDPLLRSALIRLANEHYLLALTMHHIVADGWSIGILFRELNSYLSYSRALPAGLPELPVQFGDYVLWERERSTAGTLNTQIEYWKKKLASPPKYLDIPRDVPQTRPASSQGALHIFQLDALTSESLKRVARQEGCTLFMALLAIFKALLARYSRQEDILVGTPVSTRSRPELEPLIGCFINTLVLRTDVSAELTTRELLGRVRDTVLQSLANPDVPFEKLVKDLHLERDLSHSPLFQVAFILQNTPLASEYDIVSGGAAFDITLYTWESNSGIGCSLEYRTELFKPETIEDFANCYRTLAAEMTSQPDTPVGSLSVLSASQMAEYFEECQGPVVSYPRDLCAHEWIERQTAETPDAIAVVCGLERLTYRELSVRANRLAHRLRALGVGPDSLVGLCVDRSVDLLVAPLAVWKAGGAYVPLDSEYPRQRLAFMLQDSAASVLITQSHLLDSIPHDVPSVICLDRDCSQWEGESAQAPTPCATPENLAYVIYTSGSTGKPKGVEIAHRSLVNFLASMQREPGIASRDRLLAVTTFSFDIAGLELYLPLVTGARVVIAPRGAVLDGMALGRMLSDSGITMMQATPVIWRVLLESGWQGTAGLKILCGGETLPRELAERLLATGAEVWNLYGPTETTIWSTLQRIESQAGRVPIGRPIGNTQVYLMDAHGQAVPPGVAGELYIGGDGLARGYLNRPELTAARFVEHPFHAGERLYRTGDLARRMADGSLECIARMDHQVKLRGFRIEPGEIETVLEQQAGIRQAVVVVREEESGDARLIAYVTAQNRESAEPGVLRKALLTLLPEHMVPAAFVYLEEFPLTANKKVDRKALPAPDRTAAGPSVQVPPRTATEREVAAIWQDLLRGPRLGIHDNFFDLGGHSLLVVQLQSRLRRQFQREISLVELFQHPTVAAIAGLLNMPSATPRGSAKMVASDALGNLHEA